MSMVLTIEDDEVTAREIIAELEQHGIEVDWVDNGRDGLVKAVGPGYDAIPLDRMLPGVAGLAIVPTLCQVGIETHVLMQIGRASCRERAGQYVVNSVVAVNLK